MSSIPDWSLDVDAEVVPSRVRGRRWLFSDPSREVQEHAFRGKWMLQFDNEDRDQDGLTTQDWAWVKIKHLCDQGQLLFAKASTGSARQIRSHDSSLGLIHCYTADYRDTEDVRLKVEAIRSALKEEIGDMQLYYKAEGEVRDMGHQVVKPQDISIYRHLSDNTLWKRGGGKRWDPL